MIAGVGTDMCSIARMRRAIENDHFVRRIFSAEEIAYANAKGEPARHYASAYAAKEALAKASGLGMFGMGLADSHVIRTENGPVMVCSDTLRAKMEAHGIGKCWLSLTHEGDYAMAFVILEALER